MQPSWLAATSTNKHRPCTENKMFVTEFLPESQYYLYGDWLRKQDDETRQAYFGTAGGVGVIESLMDRIEAKPELHHFLVAKNCQGWLGTLHIAELENNAIEFGVIVDRDLRGEGIGSHLIDEGITWARNRGYNELYMHCLAWNQPVRHLCQKHGLKTRNLDTDAEVQIQLDPPTWITLQKEIAYKNRNIWHTFLQDSQFLFREIYG
jgi:GNAT superfamily N-acetyltransferase